MSGSIQSAAPSDHQQTGFIVDVRTPEEFAAGHVPGALNLPLQQLAGRQAELGPKSTPITLYCRSGARSATAAALLARAGFTRVTDIGAMSNWRRR
jgi:phage shock protein E